MESWFTSRCISSFLNNADKAILYIWIYLSDILVGYVVFLKEYFKFWKRSFQGIIENDMQMFPVGIESAVQAAMLHQIQFASNYLCLTEWATFELNEHQITQI